MTAAVLTAYAISGMPSALQILRAAKSSISGWRVTGTSFGDAFVLRVGTGGVSAASQAFVIVSSYGAVGIGTTNPQATLDVNGTSTFRGVAAFEGANNFYVRYASGTLNGQTSVTIQNVNDSLGNPVIAANRPCALHVVAQAAAAVNYLGWWNGDNNSTHYGIYGYIIGPATENYQACSTVPLNFDGAGVSGFILAANAKASMDITWDSYTSNTSLFGRRQGDAAYSGYGWVSPYTGSYSWSGNGAAPSSFSFGTTTLNGNCGIPTNTQGMYGYWEPYCTQAHQ